MDTRGASRFLYDGRTVRLHWVSAALVAGLWILGQTIDDFARGEPRIAARSLHILLGCILGLVLLYRIWWRSTQGDRPPRDKAGGLEGAARLLHLGLYAMLVVTVIAGLANVWVRGDHVFHLIAIPEFDPGNKPLREQVEDVHALLANILAAGAALHAAAGLFHRLVLRDNVMQRMSRGK